MADASQLIEKVLQGNAVRVSTSEIEAKLEDANKQNESLREELKKQNVQLVQTVKSSTKRENRTFKEIGGQIGEGLKGLGIDFGGFISPVQNILQNVNKILDGFFEVFKNLSFVLIKIFLSGRRKKLDERLDRLVSIDTEQEAILNALKDKGLTDENFEGLKNIVAQFTGDKNSINKIIKNAKIDGKPVEGLEKQFLESVKNQLLTLKKIKPGFGFGKNSNKAIKNYFERIQKLDKESIDQFRLVQEDLDQTAKDFEKGNIFQQLNPFGQSAFSFLIQEDPFEDRFKGTKRQLKSQAGLEAGVDIPTTKEGGGPSLKVVSEVKNLVKQSENKTDSLIESGNIVQNIINNIVTILEDIRDILRKRNFMSAREVGLLEDQVDIEQERLSEQREKDLEAQKAQKQSKQLELALSTPAPATPDSPPKLDLTQYIDDILVGLGTGIGTPAFLASLTNMFPKGTGKFFGIGLLAGVVLMFADSIVDRFKTKEDSLQNELLDITSSTAKGAAIGRIFGPQGLIAGAIAGFLFEGFQKLDSWASESEFLDTLFPNRVKGGGVGRNYIGYVPPDPEINSMKDALLKPLEDQYVALKEIAGDGLLGRDKKQQEAFDLMQELRSQHMRIRRELSAEEIKAMYNEMKDAKSVSTQNFNTTSNVFDNSSYSPNNYYNSGTPTNLDPTNLRTNYSVGLG